MISHNAELNKNSVVVVSCFCTNFCDLR